MGTAEELRRMVDEDINRLENLLKTSLNEENTESEMQLLYKDLTAKYHSHIQGLGEGLYGYYNATGFYDQVSGELLEHNLRQVCSKLKMFRFNECSTSFSARTGTGVQFSIHTHNHLTVNISFAQARQDIEDMPSLSPNERQKILDKINELERIVHSNDSKEGKWDQAKNIIKWVADKGVDVGIAFLPLLLQIK